MLCGRFVYGMEGPVYSEDDWLAVRRDLFMAWKDWFTVRTTGLLCGRFVYDLEGPVYSEGGWFSVRKD